MFKCQKLTFVHALFYKADVVRFVRHSLSIDAHCRSQPNKSKQVLYKPLIHFNSCLKQLCRSNKTERFSYKGGVVHVGIICILRSLKKSWLGLLISSFEFSLKRL